MQKYIDICNEKAGVSAQRLRNMANVIGDEQHYEDGVCTIADVQRMTKGSIKKTATELQNLVHTMTEQLAVERAEFERMERLYKMARRDIQDLKTQVSLLKETGYDPDFHRMQSDGSY